MMKIIQNNKAINMIRSFVVVMGLLLIAPLAHANESCFVLNQIDEMNPSKTDDSGVKLYNYDSLRQKIDFYNAHGSQSICDIPGGNFDDLNGSYDRAIYFMTLNWDALINQAMDINGSIDTGKLYYSNHVNLIDVVKPFYFNNKAGLKLALGNWSRNTLPPRNNDWGYVVLNFKNVEATPIFSCGPDQPNKTITLRNVVISTKGINKADMFKAASCLEDGGDVWVCEGVMHPGIVTHTLMPGAPGWCNTSGQEPDTDGDGYCTDLNNNGECDGNSGSQIGDCDDADASVNPGVKEICTNGKDDDCDGDIDANDSDCVDQENPDKDGDGYCAIGIINCPDDKKPNDCDDNNRNRHPDAIEIPGNGVDEDCVGADGSCSLTALPTEISIQQGKDYDFSVKYMTSGGYTGGSRVFVNGLHSTMTSPEMTVYLANETHPINIATSLSTPVANYSITFSTKQNSGTSTLISGNAHSNELSGITGFQVPTTVSPSLSAHNSLTSLNGASQTGRVTAVAGQTVCSATVRLTVTKADGEGDKDGDGYCEDINQNGECDNNPDKTPGDCDDNNPDVHPDADELCTDNIDNNCDGFINEGCGPGEPDIDGDGYCVDTNQNGVCDNNPDKTPGDCDDTNRNVHPGAEELCTDAIDNNCDGNINEGCLDGEVDKDGDGYCVDTNNNGRCDYAPGAIPGDCNDNNFNINPGMDEICDDNIDNNCDGAIDDISCINPQEPGNIPGGGMRLLGSSCSLNTTGTQSTSEMLLLLAFVLVPLILRTTRKTN